MSLELYPPKAASESSAEERRCYIAVIISNVYCLNESGSKLDSLWVNRKAESHLKEIPNQASCLPGPDYLPINMKIIASRLFNSCRDV